MDHDNRPKDEILWRSNLQNSIYCIVHSHLMTYATFEWFIEYIDDGENIDGDGFCGYRALWALMLQYKRLVHGDIDLDHSREKHDTLLKQPLDDVIALFDAAILKVAQLIELKAFDSNEDVLFHAAKDRLSKARTFLKSDGAREDFFYSDTTGWCEVSIAPLLSVLLFQENSPVMVFKRNQAVSKLVGSSYMSFSNSNCMMMDGLHTFDHFGSKVARDVSYFETMLKRMNGNMLVHNGRGHFFVGRILDADIEIR